MDLSTMRFNGSDPPNGAPVTDPFMALLLKQSDKTDRIIHSLGGVEQQLKQGHALHRDLITEQKRHGQAIQRLDEAHRKTQQEVRQLKRRRPTVPKIEDVKDFIKMVREGWQYLLLAAAVAGKVFQWLSTHIVLFGAS